jgi:hypothetical protein
VLIRFSQIQYLRVRGRLPSAIVHSTGNGCRHQDSRQEISSRIGTQQILAASFELIFVGEEAEFVLSFSMDQMSNSCGISTPHPPPLIPAKTF